MRSAECSTMQAEANKPQNTLKTIPGSQGNSCWERGRFWRSQGPKSPIFIQHSFICKERARKGPFKSSSAPRYLKNTHQIQNRRCRLKVKRTVFVDRDFLMKSKHKAFFNLRRKENPEKQNENVHFQDSNYLVTIGSGRELENKHSYCEWVTQEHCPTRCLMAEPEPVSCDFCQTRRVPI